MKWLGLAILSIGLSGCSTLRHLDTKMYGDPPASLTRDATVYVSFKDEITSSMTCGKKAFGPLGAFLPTHGCAVARGDEPIRMVLPIGGALRGETRIVEFISPSQAGRRCNQPDARPGNWAGLPEGSCEYRARGEDKARLIVPNPCEMGSNFLCHELGHVNQFANGWVDASLSPAMHWGRPAPFSRTLVAKAGPVFDHAGPPVEAQASQHGPIEATGHGAIGPAPERMRSIASGQTRRDRHVIHLASVAADSERLATPITTGAQARGAPAAPGPGVTLGQARNAAKGPAGVHARLTGGMAPGRVKQLASLAHGGAVRAASRRHVDASLGTKRLAP
jgi:hypothetical protein